MVDADDNTAHVTWALDLLKQELQPFVEQRFQSRYGKDEWRSALERAIKRGRTWRDESDNLDVQALFDVIADKEAWSSIFGSPRGPLEWADRRVVSDLWDARSKWAHQGVFSSADTYRVLDNVSRLLAAVGAKRSPELVRRLRCVLPHVYDEMSIATGNSALESVGAVTTHPVTVQRRSRDGATWRVTVCQQGTGDYSSLSMALQVVPAGTRIDVLPGRYDERLVIDKGVEIVGIGDTEQVVLHPTDGFESLDNDETEAVVTVAADHVRLRNLTIKGYSESPVIVEDGSLHLDQCRVEEGEIAAVIIRGPRTRVFARRCTLEGVRISRGSQALIEDCLLDGWDMWGLESAGQLVARRCTITGQIDEIVALTSGDALLEDCHILDRAGDVDDGVKIGLCAATLRRCRVYNVRGVGISLIGAATSGAPTIVGSRRLRLIEDCEISGTGGAGVRVRGAASVTIRHCEMRHTRGAGVLIEDGGEATLEDSTLHANALSGIEIAGNSSPVVRKCIIGGSKQAGIFIHGNLVGQGLIEDCEIMHNSLSGIHVGEDGKVVARRCQVTENGAHAIYVDDEGSAMVADCDLTGNAEGSIYVEQSGRVHEERNRLDPAV